MIRKILGIINIITAIVSFILLELSDTGVIFSTIMMLTLFVGWILPFIALLLSGIAIIIYAKYYVSLIFNITNILLTIIILFLCISVYESSLMLIIIEYSIIILLSILNIIYIIKNKEEIITENLKRTYIE